MKKILLSVLAICCAATSLEYAQAADGNLRDKVVAASADSAPLNSLSEKDYDAFSQHIEKGQTEWIKEVPAFAKRTDASYSEGLTISLASGLEHNPAAVLAVIDDKSALLSTKRVCSVPFIEMSDKDADAYVKKTNNALKRVNVPSLQDKKASCLKILNLPAGTPIN